MIYQMTTLGLEEGFKDFYKHILDGLLDQVPEDASASSTIRRIDKRYVGMLNICSTGAHFVARALEKSPQETVNSLVKQIQDQIRMWHKTRWPLDERAA